MRQCLLLFPEDSRYSRISSGRSAKSLQTSWAHSSCTLVEFLEAVIQPLVSCAGRGCEEGRSVNLGTYSEIRTVVLPRTSCIPAWPRGPVSNVHPREQPRAKPRPGAFAGLMLRSQDRRQEPRPGKAGVTIRPRTLQGLLTAGPFLPSVEPPRLTAVALWPHPDIMKVPTFGDHMHPGGEPWTREPGQ